MKFVTIDNRMKKSLLLSTLLTIFAFNMQAQTLDDAKKWYLEGDFEKAKPIFAAEHALNPEDASLNQWLGVCELKDGNFFAAEKLLSVAASKGIPEAYFHLALLYVQRYQFSDAHTQFDKYRRIKRRDKEALAKLEKAEMKAESFRKFVARTEDIQLIDSMVVPKSAFLSAYRLSPSAGTLSIENQLSVFMNERKDRRYFSRADSVNGLDLYVMEKLLDHFGNEKRLSESVNDTHNQAYPFVMPDGLTLYFASTGDESVGGYDLFVTRYHLASDSYLKPNHLNAPFNSPFNDYMMVIDEDQGIGWFASDRFQPKDLVCVYTFIPNNEVKLIESDDEDYLARRASIHSIRDSWKPDVDYALLLSKNNTHTDVADTQKADFSFVINDRFTYSQLSDFKSMSAKEQFLQFQLTSEKLKKTETELAQKRTEYARATQAEQQNMRTQILLLEKEQEQLHLKTKQCAKKARNEEIRYNHWNNSYIQL